MNFYAPFSAALVTLLLIKFLLANRFASIFQDIPDERSLHNLPVPRVGGIGLITGLMVGWTLLYNVVTWWLLIPLITLFSISILDDVYTLGVKPRLAVHVFAGVIVVAGTGIWVQQGMLVAVLVVLLIVWMTNLFNFMDGADGLAGGMAIIGFSMYGIAFLMSNSTQLSMLNFCIAASSASFLYFNFHPARVFMGDAGSIPLGFLAAVMGIWGWQQGSWTVWFPLLVFSPFIVDTTVTLIKRTLRGAKISEAHREHYYQRLVMLGWGHRKVALAEYFLMFAVGISALFVKQDPFPWLIIIVCALVYACLMLLINNLWKIFKRVESV